MKLFSKRSRRRKGKNVPAQALLQFLSGVEVERAEEVQTVAVIAAAMAMMLERQPGYFRVRSIRCVTERDSPWALAGKLRLIRQGE